MKNQNLNFKNNSFSSLRKSINSRLENLNKKI